ncbi:alpha/beta hydrolase [Marinibacterium profundimaris]|uniref:Alpha/beta hydrolase n=2 Tax=Marinibacterium profundimaris TaxID=1679460 RepID=A0A225NGI3_9RHOB|nr:alpha/beta hydrolase [Marinibacterium profundimaris]
MEVIPGFSHEVAEVNGQRIGYSRGGQGAPVLLLHGFPQTRAMWREIAPKLARDYTVIAADLRGYGESSAPGGVEGMTFREMAADQAALMSALGFERFHLVGHDRGARTGHRMGLDHGKRLLSLTLMDIVPTRHLLRHLTAEVAAAYYHWFFLAQPAPFPEQMIAADPDRYFERCLLGFGKAELSDFPAAALELYRQSWRRPVVIAAMCDDYRAALTLDLEADRKDLKRRVPCPALVLYGAQGAMARHYDVPATWTERLSDMQTEAIPGGHFFIEQSPDETLAALRAFLGST